MNGSLTTRTKYILPSTSGESALTGMAFGLTAAFIWAGFPALTAFSIGQSLTPADITALRFGIAGVLLAPVFLRRGLGTLKPIGALLLAVGAGAPYVYVTAAGLQYAPAQHFGVITPSCMLLFSALGSRIFLGDKISAARVVGMLVIVAGLFALGFEAFSGFGGNTWIGDLMYMSGGLLWASYTVASRYFGMGALHATSIVAVFSLIGYMPYYFATSGLSLLEAPVREVLIQAFFQGILSGIVALLCYTRAIALLGAARGSIFAALVPSFALLLAIPILGDYPTTLQIVGVTLVTSGMLVALGLLSRNPWAGQKAVPKASAN